MSISTTANKESRVTRTNPEWLNSLSGRDSGQTEALEDLRGLLLHAALYTLVTHHQDVSGLEERERLALAEDCAQEALLAVLGKLDEFRGDSKFTTWAYKFGINIALTHARRERWKRVSLDALAEDEHALDWFQRQEGFQTADSEAAALQSEVSDVIKAVIRNDLTDRQRQVLKWIAFDDVPMDVVVDRLETNRNAVYKLLHDARLKVKRRLAERGYKVEEVYQLFRLSNR